MEGGVVHGGGGAPGRLLVVDVRRGGDHGSVHCKGNNFSYIFGINKG